MYKPEPSSRKKRYISWQEYAGLEKKIVDEISACIADGKILGIDVVVGIFRGGMVLSRSISSKLGEIPLAIAIFSGNESEQVQYFGEIDFLDLNDRLKEQITILIVDDISDTGNTLKRVKKNLQDIGFKNIITSGLILKKYSSFSLDFYGEFDESKDWIVFPWE